MDIHLSENGKTNHDLQVETYESYRLKPPDNLGTYSEIPKDKIISSFKII
jgi:hypothetical protein